MKKKKKNGKINKQINELIKYKNIQTNNFLKKQNTNKNK